MKRGIPSLLVGWGMGWEGLWPWGFHRPLVQSAEQTSTPSRPSRPAFPQGILFRGGDVLEKLAAVNTVVLDKTGTLTRGKMDLEGITPLSADADEEKVCSAGRWEAMDSNTRGRACRRGNEDVRDQGARDG